MILHVMRMRNFKEGVKEYFNLIKSIYINLQFNIISLHQHVHLNNLQIIIKLYAYSYFWGTPNTYLVFSIILNW